MVKNIDCPWPFIYKSSCDNSGWDIGGRSRAWTKKSRDSCKQKHSRANRSPHVVAVVMHLHQRSS